MKYDMVHEDTVKDIIKAEGIAYGCKMNVAVVEFEADGLGIMRLKRLVLTDRDLCLSHVGTREMLMPD